MKFAKGLCVSVCAILATACAMESVDSGEDLKAPGGALGRADTPIASVTVMCKVTDPRFGTTLEKLEYHGPLFRMEHKQGIIAIDEPCRNGAIKSMEAVFEGQVSAVELFREISPAVHIGGVFTRRGIWAYRLETPFEVNAPTISASVSQGATSAFRRGEVSSALSLDGSFYPGDAFSGTVSANIVLDENVVVDPSNPDALPFFYGIADLAGLVPHFQFATSTTDTTSCPTESQTNVFCSTNLDAGAFVSEGQLTAIMQNYLIAWAEPEQGVVFVAQTLAPHYETIGAFMRAAAPSPWEI